MRFVLKLIVGVFAAVGFLVVASGAAIGFLVARGSAPPPPPSETLLEWVAEGPLAAGAEGRLGALVEDRMSLDGLVARIDAARTDPRVKGFVARLGGVALGPAEVQELRAAIGRFRAAGKFTAVHAANYDTSSYWLASAFGEVWLQPSGTVSATGPAILEPFAREALDQAGIEPRFERREGFKSAPETLTERGPTPEHREMTAALVGDIGRQFVEAIAADRGLSPVEARAAIDRAPLLEDEAQTAKLVDRLGWRDEFAKEAARRVDNARTLSIAAYHPHPVDPKAPTIALIRASGDIVDDESPDGRDGSITPGRLVPAFDAAAGTDEVKAIVFRVDSGGGSATAADAVRRALIRSRAAGKPVIVSMGGAAASGGYWIAMNADRIVAEPATLTGSIGVFVGKLSFEGLSNRLGVRWDGALSGRNAGIWSPLRPFDAAGEERIKAVADRVYARFLTNVAEARHLTPEATREVARGRVWTGAQARDRGLVDALGGLDVALVEARRAAGLAEGAAIKLREFPAPKTPLEEIRGLIAGNRGLIAGAATLARSPAATEGMAALIEALDVPVAGVSATADLPRIR